MTSPHPQAERQVHNDGSQRPMHANNLINHDERERLLQGLSGREYLIKTLIQHSAPLAAVCCVGAIILGISITCIIVFGTNRSTIQSTVVIRVLNGQNDLLIEFGYVY